MTKEDCMGYLDELEDTEETFVYQAYADALEASIKFKDEFPIESSELLSISKMCKELDNRVLNLMKALIKFAPEYAAKVDDILLIHRRSMEEPPAETVSFSVTETPPTFEDTSGFFHFIAKSPTIRSYHGTTKGEQQAIDGKDLWIAIMNIHFSLDNIVIDEKLPSELSGFIREVRALNHIADILERRSMALNNAIVTRYSRPMFYRFNLAASNPEVNKAIYENTRVVSKQYARGKSPLYMFGSGEWRLPFKSDQEWVNFMGALSSRGVVTSWHMDYPNVSLDI